MPRYFCIFLAICAVAPVGVAIGQLSHAAAQSPTQSLATKVIKPSPPITSALCVLKPLGGASGIEGAVTFVQADGYVLIDAEVTGLTLGKHGFHIHEYGDCTEMGGACAGVHFNPVGMPHAGPNDRRRHAGDLENLVADKEGVAKFQIKDKVIRLRGERSILGRGIVINADPDDLTTQPSGNAGKRIVCGIIGAAMEE